MPLVWELVRPRRGLLAIGFVLMAINRIAAFVLPSSTRYLIDNVITKRQTQLLKPLVLAVLLATLIQGSHVLRPHAVAFQGGAAADHGAAAKGAVACLPVVGFVS